VRNTSGAWFVYRMNDDGLTVLQKGYMPFNNSLYWEVAGIGDFNGDGNSDVLIRNTSGAWFSYLMNDDGLTVLQKGSVPFNNSLYWQQVIY